MDAGLHLIAKNSPHLRQLYLRRCINITGKIYYYYWLMMLFVYCYSAIYFEKYVGARYANKFSYLLFNLSDKHDIKVLFYLGRGVSEKVSAVGFCLGSCLFGSWNSY